MRIGESVQSVGHRFEFVFQRVDRLGQQLPERVASMRSNKITRIDTFWQGQNPKIDLIFFKQCQQRVENFVRATPARLVAIEHERDAIGVAAQKLQMALAERGAEHGDAVVDAVLMGHQAHRCSLP